MIGPRRAIPALAVAAVLAMTACGGDKAGGGDTTTSASQDTSAPAMDIGAYRVEQMAPLDANDAVSAIGLDQPTGSRVTKDGGDVLSVVNGQLPPGKEPSEETVKQSIATLAGGGTPEQVQVLGQPAWGVSNDGKAYIGVLDPSGALTVLYGPGTPQDILAALNDIQAAQSQAPQSTPTN